jgi:hypothetical protein
MLALVHHRSILAALEFLQMMAHNFVVHLLLGLWESLFYFSLPAQEVVPLTNLLSLKKNS